MLLFQKRQKIADNFQKDNEMIFEKYNDLRITLFMQMDSTIIYHKCILKDKQTLHSSAMEKKYMSLKKIQKLVVEMQGIMVQEKQYASARKRNIKSKSENIVTLSDRFTQNKYEMMLWKA